MGLFLLLTWVVFSKALARAKRAQRTTMGKKIWLSMHPRNFGSEKIVHTSVNTSTLNIIISRGEILHFMYPRVLVVNRIATRTFRDKTFCLKQQQRQQRRFFFFDLILMSTLTWIAEKELKIKKKNK